MFGQSRDWLSWALQSIKSQHSVWLVIDERTSWDTLRVLLLTRVVGNHGISRTRYPLHVFVNPTVHIDRKTLPSKSKLRFLREKTIQNWCWDNRIVFILLFLQLQIPFSLLLVVHSYFYSIRCNRVAGTGKVETWKTDNFDAESWWDGCWLSLIVYQAVFLLITAVCECFLLMVIILGMYYKVQVNWMELSPNSSHAVLANKTTCC